MRDIECDRIPSNITAVIQQAAIDGNVRVMEWVVNRLRWDMDYNEPVSPEIVKEIEVN